MKTFKQFIVEAKDPSIGKRVIEFGHDVGKVVSMKVDKHTGGDVYVAVDADGDEFTFSVGDIKKVTHNSILISNEANN